MQELFITSIHIGKVRHLESMDIALSDSERKHLILTGKNGSGKTSVLEALRDSVLLAQRAGVSRKYSLSGMDVNMFPGLFDDQIEMPDMVISYSLPGVELYDKVFVYLPAERSRTSLPKSIEPISIQGKSVITRNASKDFLKYLLSLDYQLYGAKMDRNAKLEGNLTQWFTNFENALRDIYDCRELQLQRNTKNLEFRISMPGREQFGLHEMADGYKAFIDILIELLMRMETSDGIVNYEQAAIVFIDELETHLHVELQRRALPFLTKMFPNTQFIVATHSPFVITSLPNAIVYDLETHTRLEGDLTEYSYTDIVEGYFDVSECSESLQKGFERYVDLCRRDMLKSEEAAERYALFRRLTRIPKTSPLSTAFDLFERERKNDKAD